MADQAIGILFEVAGKGSISGESGTLINQQLHDIVKAINEDKKNRLSLKLDVDSDYINDQVKKIQKQLKELSPGASKQNKASGGKSGASNQSDAYKNALKAMKEYYDLKSKYDRKSSRTTEPDKQYSALSKSYDDATKSFSKYAKIAADGSATLKENIEGISDAQRESLQEMLNARNMRDAIGKQDIQQNAEQAWSNLTQKVHDYIDRVEYAASRNEDAAQGLKDLRELANKGDYHAYDELKKKLADIQGYINENSLATETWGQKMVKTFGSRVRSALAGVMTAKLGQCLRDVYNNVVELDKALVNLQIASGKTREETKALIKEYAGLAKQLGATTVEVAEAADTWLRQGYSSSESTTLIKNSTMLAKLGQMEMADASRSLTSAMKGYNVVVEESIGIVDKFTAVDMEAAASAGDIATAMAETATSAKIAGVSMDKLIGYIATVKEVTQDGSESVGK